MTFLVSLLALLLSGLPTAAPPQPAPSVSVSAISRGAVQVLPEPDVASRLGADSGAGSPTLPAPLTGKASYVGQRYGSRYLALPGGPGIRVRICSSKACVLRVSTDAGPDKAMQRAGRIADLSYADFRTLCRCRPELVGLLRVTITTGGPALPATDAP